MPVNFDRKILVQLDDQLYEGLRLDFSIVKTLGGAPLNKAKITIYNVSDSTYEQVLDRGRDLAVQVFAGYGLPNRLFIGNPVKNGVEFTWDGADKRLQLSCQDGYKRYQRARLNVSFDADSIRLSDIASEVAKKLQLPIGIVDFPDDLELTQGLVLSGSAREVLDRITASSGAQWSIQDGALQILPRRKVRRSSGPRYSSEQKNVLSWPALTDDGIKLQTFLDSSIVPGDRFQVDVGDKRLDGTWKSTTIKHTGSVWDSQFYSDIEGRRWTQTAGKADEPTAAQSNSVERLLDPVSAFQKEIQAAQEAELAAAHESWWSGEN